MFALKNKQLTASGQVTTKVSAGTNTLSAPARVVGLNIRCGGTLGRVDLIDNGSGGTVKFTIPTPAIGSGEDEILQVNFPDPGLRFETDLYCFFNQATHVEVLYG
jgi:hypothetical protein